MRPRRLKLRGFITYKDTIEIDFTKLYDKKIFLISGDTGSGKTSIFDAISFALYGNVARDISSDRLRCDFLSEEDPYTYVNLEFDVGARTYRIERIPRQRAKKTKIGQSIGNAVALFDITEEEILLSEKQGETDEMIKNIIGLDDKQFSKVMLLAQGKFQEFLKAKSTDKAKLLGDIFKTYEYKDFQEKIKNLAKDSIKEMDYIDKEVAGVIDYSPEIKKLIDRDYLITHDFSAIEKILFDGKSRLDKTYEEITSKEEKMDLLIKKLIGDLEEGKRLNENIEKYKTIEKDLEQLLSHEEENKILLEKIRLSDLAKNILVYEKNYKYTLCDIKKLEDGLGESEKIEKEEIAKNKTLAQEMEGLADKKSILDKKKIEKENMDKLLENYKTFLKAKKSYKDMEKIKEERQDNLASLENLDKEFKNLRQIFDLNNELIGEISEKGTNENKNLTNLSENIRKLEEDRKKLLEIKDHKEKISKLSTDKDKLEEIEKKALASEDLIIINKLIDRANEEGLCPVCLKKQDKILHKHPIEDIDLNLLRKNLANVNQALNLRKESLGKIEKDLTSKDNLEQIEKLLEGNYVHKKAIEENILRLRKDYQKRVEDRKSFKKSLDKLTEEIKTSKDKDKSLLDMLSANKDAEITYLSQKDLMKDFDEKILEEKSLRLKEEIEGLEKEISDISKTFQKSQLRLKEIQTNIENKKENLKDLLAKAKTSKDDFEEKVKESFADKESYQASLLASDKLLEKKDVVDSYFKTLSKAKISLDNFASYKDQKPVDLEKIEKEIEIEDLNKKELSIKKAEIYARIKIFSKTYQRIGDLKKSYEKGLADAESLARLSKVADGSFGKVIGREKIDFETFVLTYYFDKVLSLANLRLMDMTGNQFSMIRKSEAEDQRSKAGLDIEILDANTGKARPASTLSGGESFLASLSLALGLSDEISMENGGIRIDTLFIDEGFGTLSKDYLDKAISTIEKLAYEDKFIGLISHVDELKEAIDAKINVTYTPSHGSKVEVCG